MSLKNFNDIQHRTDEENLEGDQFTTPRPLAASLVAKIDLDGARCVLDGFKGSGAFFDAFPRNVPKDWCEIQEGRDFYKYNAEVDWIISNPPFSQFRRVLEHSCKIAQVGFAYIMPGYALSHSRLRLIASFGFYCTQIYSFENPKEWGFGFPMLFCVFRKTSWPSAAIGLIGEPEKLQLRLNECEGVN